MSKKMCKCGKACGEYASCEKCREYHAKWLRGNRAKLKAERGFTQWRYAPPRARAARLGIRRRRMAEAKG